MTREVLNKINKAVGFRLVTKFGTKGLINLGKVVPVLGGVIGGGLDAFTTNIVGNQARNTFLQFEPTKHKLVSNNLNLKDVN